MERKSSESHLAAVKKYDAEKMSFQTFKVRKELLEEFKAIAARRGEKVNSLLKDYVIDYINKHRAE